jgi:2-keto-4-pentenoate hydratase/2-oxohepta-3-ene-1,7-dioic acid hydratase in catechol pathway
MKIASFAVGARATYGLVTPDGIVDLAPRTGLATLRALLDAGGLAQAQTHASAPPDFALDAVDFLPVIPAPEHVVCVGINYASHIAEVASAGIRRATPDKPSIFLRCADSLVAHRQPLVLPRVSACLDYEAELAVVIGKPGRYIAQPDALDHVAGYTCFNDGSVRDWQFHTNNITPGKNFPSTGALGPWLVTCDEIEDPQRLRIRTLLNDRTMQDGNTSDMIFSVRDIIAYVSSFIRLVPGDIIATGTPDGVGFSRKPAVYMADDDVCTVDIESIGRLVNPVRREAVPDHGA